MIGGNCKEIDSSNIYLILFKGDGDNDIQWVLQILYLLYSRTYYLSYSYRINDFKKIIDNMLSELVLMLKSYIR